MACTVGTLALRRPRRDMTLKVPPPGDLGRARAPCAYGAGAADGGAVGVGTGVADGPGVGVGVGVVAFSPINRMPLTRL